MSQASGLLQSLLDLAARAGDAIQEHYEAPGADRYQSKGDDSPLTQADLASHHILQAGLEALHPVLPVLSEESPASVLAQRRQWPRYWLVDPLDGTKEFLARTGEFTINIALIEHHRPQLGLLYLPLQRTAYSGESGGRAIRHELDADGHWRRQELSTRALPEDAPVVVHASRRHRGAKLEDCLDWLVAQRGPIERRDSGSALKFCRMAEGEGDFYPRFARCCEWDTAAGQAVVEAAGGAVVGLDGQPLEYNRGDSLYSPPFFALADPVQPLWRDLLARF